MTKRFLESVKKAIREKYLRFKKRLKKYETLEKYTFTSLHRRRSIERRRRKRECITANKRTS